jgi:hypothetical protein
VGAAFGFGGWDALDAVHAAFGAEEAVGIWTGNLQDGFEKGCFRCGLGGGDGEDS